MEKYFLSMLLLTNLIGQVDYTTQIQPIFDNNCISCHANGGGYAGNLDLSSYAEIMEGGNSGNTIVPSDHSSSDLYARITLPVSDQQFMPKYSSPLYQSDIDLIAQWIDEGALASSFSTTLHVATTGSDDTGDGSEDNPYATIQKGVDMSMDGDTVLVGSGEYLENLIISSEILLLSQNGPLETIIDGSCDIGQCQVITVPYVSEVEYLFLNVEGFTITGGKAYEDYDAGWLGGAIGAYDTWGVDSLKLNNMIFKENDGFDINLGHNQVQFADIQNSTFIKDGEYMMENRIFDGDFSGGANITNSIFYGESPWNPIIFNFSHCLSFGDINIGNLEEGNGNMINIDPLFCNPENGDYSLAENSPAVGAGEGGTNMGAMAVGCEAINNSLTINEIMNNPSAVSDSDGEWFELFYNGDFAIDLNGWSIKDNGSDSHIISSTKTIKQIKNPPSEESGLVSQSLSISWLHQPHRQDRDR